MPAWPAQELWTDMRDLIAGNWKMNGLAADLDEAAAVAEGARALDGRVELMLCPPAILIERMRRRTAGTPLRIGAQDCHPEAAGAHTGDISAEMLKDAGIELVQGFYFSPPLSAAAFEAFARSREQL